MTAPPRFDYYRPEIDGLRALAVLSVMLFHFGLDSLSGGYVGVDVFFVISGFLITRMIIDSVADQSFRFSEFYIRRARRLGPALIATIAATFFVGSFILSPAHFERLGGSAVHGLLSLSNYYFWTETGYFDADSMVKPLLHLWSLGVEEQFYLVWPLTLVVILGALGRRNILPVILVVFAVLSWWIAELLIDVDKSAAFYFLPARIVEFALGALTVFLVRFHIGVWVKEFAFLLGLVLILFAVFNFDEKTRFPGSNALIPCLGAALVIVGGQAKYLGWLLRNKVMVAIGLISYSLYLCHWPLFVFYSYSRQAHSLGVDEVAVLTLVSIGVAFLMYRYVERPFRSRPMGEGSSILDLRFALSLSLISLVILFPAAHSWANQGWYWRFGNSNELADVFDLDRLRFETIQYNRENILGATFATRGTKVLVIGDSHARDVSNGLHKSLPESQYQVRVQSFDEACLDQIMPDGGVFLQEVKGVDPKCLKQAVELAASYKVINADVVVFSANFEAQTAMKIDRLVLLVKARSKNKQVKILIMGAAVRFPNFHSEAIRLYGQGTRFQEINTKSGSFSKAKRLDQVNRSLQKSVGIQEGVVVLSKRSLQCRNDSCDFFTPSGALAIWDASHWTLEGAELFVSRLIEDQPDLF